MPAKKVAHEDYVPPEEVSQGTRNTRWGSDSVGSGIESDYVQLRLSGAEDPLRASQEEGKACVYLR